MSAGGTTPDCKRLESVLSELSGLGIRTALFMDPEPQQIAAAASAGADRIIIGEALDQTNVGVVALQSA